MTNRRHFLALAGAGAALAACGDAANGAGDRPTGELAADRALGSPGAPVTVIEYASVMCVHCQSFHLNTWPAFKEKYVDSGKVRFIFREIPTAPSDLAMAGFLLARCAPEDKYFDVIDVLFHQRNQILQASATGQAREIYLRIARSAGVSEDQFDACLSDEDEIKRIAQVGEDAADRYGQISTPMFIIDGEAHVGAMPLEEFDALLAPLLGDEAPADTTASDG
jgi:protein-disulfide isomerase